MPTDTRQRILAAVRALLTKGGLDAVTLEAVAEQAGISKGGLLYHFPSKAALYLGLLGEARDRVVTEMDERMQTMHPARAYLDYATPTESDDEFGTALITAVTNGENADPAGKALMVDGFRMWERPMQAAVADPVQAELIRLVGMGVYLSAISGIPRPDPSLLDQVYQRLLDAVPDSDRPL